MGHPSLRQTGARGSSRPALNPIDLLLCRPGLEEACRDECREAGLATRCAVPGSGVVGVQATPPPLPDWIFARQRMPQAEPLAVADLRPLSPTVVEPISLRLDQWTGLWTVHVTAADDAPVRPDGVRRALERELGKADSTRRKRRIDSARAARKRRVAVVQVRAGRDRGWWSVAPMDQLVSPYPGGILRMPRDPNAPSRSVLKLEEAFYWLGCEPQPNDRVADLGAAPGGWSYACLKRGASVTAVDRGPMRIADLDRLPGRLTVVRANGLTWRPPEFPVDWLLSDMLVPPGPALGLLRAWLGASRCRHGVVTVKLPQQEIWPVLKPLLNWLNQASGWRIRVRHLYHDRREVTIMARSDPTLAFR